MDVFTALQAAGKYQGADAIQASEPMPPGLGCTGQPGTIDLGQQRGDNVGSITASLLLRLLDDCGNSELETAIGDSLA